MVKFDELIFLYTNVCNLRCGHCVSNASPEGQKTIDAEKVTSAIQDAAKHGIRRLCFTGGESLLHEEDVLDFIKYGKSLGMGSTIVTNGFWGNDPNEAKDLLDEFKTAGLDELQVSTDRFHLEYIPLSQIETIIKESKDIGLNIVILISRIKDDMIAENIKKELKKQDVEISEQSVVPEGRGVSLLGQLPLDSWTIDELNSTPCNRSINLNVSYDNRVQICCCLPPDISPESPLILGNLMEEDLDTIIRRAEKNLLADFLFFWGPVTLYEYIKTKLGDTDFVPLKEYYKPCHLCRQLLGDKRYMPLIVNLLNQEDIKLKLKAANFVYEHKNYITSSKEQ